MSILDHAKVYPTGERYAVRQPFSLILSEEKLEDTLEVAFGERYELRLALAVNFSCNRAQYTRARENAERLLLRHLYADTLRQVELCQNALYGDDIKEALLILDVLRSELIE